MDILQHPNAFTLKKIGKNRSITNKYIVLFFLIKNFNINSKKVFIKLNYKIYIINNLKTNILIGINILKYKKVIIDFPKRKIIIWNCKNIEVVIKPIAKENIYIRRILQIDKI